MDTVGRDASAVLLDPDVSVVHIVDSGALGGDVGLLVRIEADGYDVVRGLRRSRLINGLGAAGARARGATAAKVMVFLRPDREDLDGYTAQLVRGALEDCGRENLLCVMEAMTYRLEDELGGVREPPWGSCPRERGLPGGVRREIAQARVPGLARRVRAGVLSDHHSWAVLSAGVDHEEFCEQLSASVRGGAAGFIAGRSLWKECAVMRPRERRAFLEGTVRRRFEQLLAVLVAHGDSVRGVAP